MLDLSRATERRKFTDRRAELMFAVHLSTRRAPLDVWAPAIHPGTEPEEPAPLPSGPPGFAAKGNVAA